MTGPRERYPRLDFYGYRLDTNSWERMEEMYRKRNVSLLKRGKCFVRPIQTKIGEYFNFPARNYFRPIEIRRREANRLDWSSVVDPPPLFTLTDHFPSCLVGRSLVETRLHRGDDSVL